jgi:hypothetical protein
MLWCVTVSDKIMSLHERIVSKAWVCKDAANILANIHVACWDFVASEIRNGHYEYKSEA